MTYEQLKAERNRLSAILKQCSNVKHTVNYQTTERMLKEVRLKIKQLFRKDE